MKIRYYIFLFTLFLSVASCQDEDYPFVDTPGNNTPPTTRATEIASALTQDANGHWKASRRVPLVGIGRIVDNYSDALVSVAGWKENIANLVDTDISNSTSFSGVANADLLANQIASVRDLNRVYAGGQEAGFVYRTSTNGVLELSVLKSFWIKTFLRGELQETKGGDPKVETLELNLISAGNNNGKQALSISASLDKPFDEVRIGMSGVNAEVLKSLELFYAYVGENEEQKCIQGNPDFPDVKIHDGGNGSWTSIKFLATSKQLVDENTTNGVSIGTLGSLLGGLFGGFWATVDFGKTIPAGSEVGFILTQGNLLSLDIGNTMTLTTFNENDEKQEEFAVGSVLGVSAIGGGKSAVSLVTTKPCSQIKIYLFKIAVNLGATVINYAFVRDETKVDQSAYLSLPDVTIHTGSYYLVPPKTGSIRYAVTSAPQGSNPQIDKDASGKYRITGMNVNGDYRILAVYTAPDGTVMQETFTITKEVNTGGSECNKIITNEAEYAAEAYLPQGGGGLLTIDGKDEFLQHVVSSSTEDYVTYASGVSIAANVAIVGVKLGDGKSIKPATSGKNRVGFTIQTNTNVLGADVLKFMRVRLKKNGAYLNGNSVTENNDAVSAGLIGNSGVKTRLSITTDHEFDAIELWTSGVLNINTNSFRIYNAFWEPETENCTSSALEPCLELMTPVNYGAEINYEETKTVGVASVGSSFNNLGNMLDGNMATTALLTQTQVGGAMTVAVKFTPVSIGQQVGFILKKVTGLADADLIAISTLKLYSKGAEVASTAAGGVLGLDVIGNGDYQYVSTITKHDQVDEIRITFGSALSALKNIQIAGMFTRPDTDGDGFPDCSEEQEQGGNKLASAVAEPEHVCEGSPVTIRLTATVGTDLPAGNYTLKFTDITGKNNILPQSIPLAAGNTLTVNNLPAGDYYINVTSDADNQTFWNGVHVVVHPQETTWKSHNRSTDWNDWSNWTNGSPWDCTNVIIPAGCTSYPDLQAAASNYCRYIHFEHGGEVVNTHHLNYLKAWVELSLQPGRYYMLSAPLHNMVTGDMFIPRSLNGNHSTAAKFNDLDQANSPENRFAPRIFQRFWSANTTGKKITNGNLNDVIVTPDETNWTAPFNALNEAYNPGMGFSVRAEKETLPTGKLTFRFPKSHDSYTYFRPNGASTGKTETIGRDAAYAGRFIYEQPGADFPLRLTVNNHKEGTTFLIGNPFMTHINLPKFLAENTHVTSVKVYDGNRNNSQILADGELLSNGDTYHYMAPMQSVFATVATPGTSLTVTFTEDMLLQVPGNVTRSLSRNIMPRQRAGSLQITATDNHGHSASTLLRLSAHATDGYRPEEDSRLLFNNEAETPLHLFTEADGKALDIQQLRGSTSGMHIPLGFRLKAASNVRLSLHHLPGDGWSDWTLWDSRTDKRYSLQESAIEIELGQTGTHVGRFFLIKQD